MADQMERGSVESIKAALKMTVFDLPFLNDNTIYVTGWPDDFVTVPELYTTFKEYGQISRIRMFRTEALVAFQEHLSSVNAVHGVLTVKGLPVTCTLLQRPIVIEEDTD